MTDSQRDAHILQMAQDLAEIKAKVIADYRALYGNGHPGLLHEHEELKTAVIKLTAEQAPTNAELGRKITALEKENVSAKTSRATLYAVASVVIAILAAIAEIFGAFRK